LLGLRGAAAGWETQVSGTGAGVGVALTARIDGAGDVVAAGYTDDAVLGREFTVVKLAGADGREVWRRALGGANPTPPVDEARSSAFDQANNVYATGVTSAGGVPSSFTVVKLAAPTGALLWRKEIIGSGVGGEGHAVVVDSMGGAFVAGETSDPGVTFTV